MFCSNDDRQGSIVIANYIIVTTDSKTSTRRGEGQNMLFIMLSQEVHKNAYVALRKDTANDPYDLVRKCDSSTSKSARKPE